MSTRPRGRWWRRRSGRDFHDEIHSHLELEIERLIADGVDPAEARQRAHRAFGNVTTAEERFYDASRWLWLEQVRQDARYAMRTLWRSRTFVASTVLTLAVALSLVTVVFAVFNVYVLRPFAISDPYSVYQLVWREGPSEGGAQFTWREYEEVSTRHDVLDAAVAQHFQLLAVDGRRLYAAFVSGNYFEALRPQVRLGRALAGFDAAVPGSAPVAVLSDHGWAMLFDRDPHVLGRRVDLNGQQIEIVGVMRPEFSGLDDMPLDVWLPITMLPALATTDPFRPPQPRNLTIFARLRHGVGAMHANQALTPFMVGVATADAAGGRTVTASAVRAELAPRATPNPLTFELLTVLSPIFAAFGLVLVAACANVSSVMLARALGRQREIGIRLSVGASRARIVRQLLTEAAIIALLAGALGLAMAAVMLRAGRAAFFGTLPPTMAELMRVAPLDLDLRVFGFALGAAAITVVLCALLPALQATGLRLTSALRGEFAPRLRSGLLRNLLVAGQVTVSLILLIAAATLARNGVTVAATDLGFDVNGVFSINERGMSSARIPKAARILEADAGAANVAVTSSNPMFNGLGSIGAAAAGEPDTQTTAYMFVSPEYFPLLGIPLQRGRPFTAADARAEAPIGIVSERTARLFWPGTDPIGGVLRLAPQGDSQADALKGYSDITVIGVAKDVVSSMPYQGIDPAIVYLPTSRDGAHARALLVRRMEANAAEQERLSRLLERVDVNRAAFEVVTLAEIRDVLLYPLRLASWIGSLLGLVALVLSVSGLYGLLMYVLNQRTREIGIRMALGATSGRVVKLIMRQSARVVAIGMAVGLLFTYSALTLLDATLPLRAGNVSVFDGWSFAAGVALVAVAGMIASYFPARRATHVDPCATLRADG